MAPSDRKSAPNESVLRRVLSSAVGREAAERALSPEFRAAADRTRKHAGIKTGRDLLGWDTLVDGRRPSDGVAIDPSQPIVPIPEELLQKKKDVQRALAKAKPGSDEAFAIILAACEAGVDPTALGVDVDAIDRGARRDDADRTLLDRGWLPDPDAAEAATQSDPEAPRTTESHKTPSGSQARSESVPEVPHRTADLRQLPDPDRAYAETRISRNRLMFAGVALLVVAAMSWLWHSRRTIDVAARYAESAHTVATASEFSSAVPKASTARTSAAPSPAASPSITAETSASSVPPKVPSASPSVPTAPASQAPASKPAAPRSSASTFFEPGKWTF